MSYYLLSSNASFQINSICFASLHHFFSLCNTIQELLGQPSTETSIQKILDESQERDNYRAECKELKSKLEQAHRDNSNKQVSMHCNMFIVFSNAGCLTHVLIVLNAAVS